LATTAPGKSLVASLKLTGRFQVAERTLEFWPTNRLA
jgi:hypothetical protein